MFDWDIAWWEVVLRMIAGAGGGALLGWDRAKKRRPAGLRTHIMVALGATAFTVIACELFATLDRTGADERADPVRIIAAIVGGIGFLGAGAIMQSGREVRGLTTAAGLWVAASIGMAAGLGFYFIAVVVSVLGFVTLRTLSGIEQSISYDDETTTSDS